MDAKHTPGPWYAVGDTIHKDIGDRRAAVAVAINWSEETAPNARLIAAAPELLEAARYALEVIQRDRGKQARMRMHTRLQAAIAKATGAPA